MIGQILHSWVCWAILLLSVFCYQQLWQQYLYSRHTDIELLTGSTSEQHISRDFTGILIGVLPLMGLLGTIIGLLDCFADLASDGASGALLSGGIADALLTTQLGLVCALPAWMLQGSIRARLTRQQAYAVVGK